jgi:hypothetical protein
MKHSRKEMLLKIVFIFIVAVILITITSISGCVTGRLTQGVRNIDEILSDGTLTILPKDSPETIAQKKRISTVLASAREEILESENKRIAAEKSAQKSAQWSGIGKGVFGVGIFLIIAMIIILILRILKKISLPFL